MAEIRVLPQNIAELIAAGEVVDRPASIAKELLENAVDAGATRVQVQIKGGGIRYLRVADDGCGIPASQMKTAFLRHATSKITTEEQLSQIATLGFRGEALASIAAVSRVEMLSKTADEAYGHRLVVEGGAIGEIEEAGSPTGTTVVVRDLFYNTPARLKFLKRVSSESGAVEDVVKKLALSHPEIAFSFVKDEKEILSTVGKGGLAAAIRSVFGRQFSATLFPVEYEMHGMKLSGFASYPVHARANRSMQHFFVNGRYVRSGTCRIALEEGYKTATMVGKFPACVLNIEMPCDAVDVNVHPAKTEVRFSAERQVFDLIYFGIRSALLANQVLPDPSEPEPLPEPQPVNPRIRREEPQQLVMPTRPQGTPLNDKLPNSIFTLRQPEIPFGETPPAPEPESESPYQYLTAQVLRENSVKKQQDDKKTPEKEPEPQVKILGELFATYVVAEYGEQVILLDKHAAHERILYNKLASSDEPLKRQVLLTPLPVALSSEEADALLSAKEQLEELGFLIASAPDGVAVREVPSILDRQDIAGMLEEIAEKLLSQNKNLTPSVLDDLYHSVACKAAIKAGHTHSTRELEALVKEVYHDKNVRYCPHGRPVLFVISHAELDRRFGRVQ